MSTAQTDRPTATYPGGRPLATAYPLPEGWRIDPAGYLPGPLTAPTDGGAAVARLAQADATPTVVLPAEATTRAALFPEVGPADADAASIARTGARRRARVYHTPSTKGGRSALSRRESARRAERAGCSRRQTPRRHPHLRQALTALALAVAILTGLQLYAASGITSARQAALQSARTHAPAHAYSTPSQTEQAAPTSQTEGGQQPPMSGQTPAPATMSDRTSATHMSGQTDTQGEWVTQDTGAPYDSTNPHVSPLTNLPRCTTAPTTPMPCLAHVSANSDRVVVLEEDGSLTGLVRR